MLLGDFGEVQVDAGGVLYVARTRADGPCTIVALALARNSRHERVAEGRSSYLEHLGA